jgi:hypothetical protein
MSEEGEDQETEKFHHSMAGVCGKEGKGSVGRAGRAGRAGQAGQAGVLVVPLASKSVSPGGGNSSATKTDRIRGGGARAGKAEMTLRTDKNLKSLVLGGSGEGISGTSVGSSGTSARVTARIKTEALARTPLCPMPDAELERGAGAGGLYTRGGQALGRLRGLWRQFTAVEVKLAAAQRLLAQLAAAHQSRRLAGAIFRAWHDRTIKDYTGKSKRSLWKKRGKIWGLVGTRLWKSFVRSWGVDQVVHRWATHTFRALRSRVYGGSCVLHTLKMSLHCWRALTQMSHVHGIPLYELRAREETLSRASFFSKNPFLLSRQHQQGASDAGGTGSGQGVGGCSGGKSSGKSAGHARGGIQGRGAGEGAGGEPFVHMPGGGDTSRIYPADDSFSLGVSGVMSPFDLQCSRCVFVCLCVYGRACVHMRVHVRMCACMSVCEPF